jgi:hypothetical protein
MQIKDSHTYAAPLDVVLDMFADADATRAKYEGMGHRDVEIRDVARTPETLTIATSRVVDVDLPGFARRVLKPTNTMRQTDEWRSGSGGGWTGTFAVEVEGAPVELSGEMRLVPGEGTCTHEVTITMNVKVPIVGGKIADWVGKNDARRTLEAEFAFGDTWLADHPG